MLFDLLIFFIFFLVGFGGGWGFVCCRFVSGTEQGSRVVLLLSAGPEVSKRAQVEPSYESWLLEGDGEGSKD